MIEIQQQYIYFIHISILAKTW